MAPLSSGRRVRFSMKLIAVLGALCLFLPGAAWAKPSNSNNVPSNTCFPGFVCLFNQGGTAVGGTSGLIMNGTGGSVDSTLIGIGSFPATGTLSLTTGALMSGNLSGAGCGIPPCTIGVFNAGTISINVTNYFGFTGTIFGGTFGTPYDASTGTGGIAWVFTGTIGTGKNKVYQYELIGPVSGQWEGGQTIGGQTAQLYFTTKTPYTGGTINLSSGTTALVVPEPAGVGLMGTGLVLMGLLVRRKANGAGRKP